jgi:hypothetical protein
MREPLGPVGVVDQPVQQVLGLVGVSIEPQDDAVPLLRLLLDRPPAVPADALGRVDTRVGLGELVDLGPAGPAESTRSICGVTAPPPSIGIGRFRHRSTSSALLWQTP